MTKNKAYGLIAAGLFVATAIAATVGFSKSAEAGQCYGDINNNPCAMFWRQKYLDVAGGGVVTHRHVYQRTKVASTTRVIIRQTISGGDMVSVVVRARTRSPLVLYVGEYSGSGAPRNVLKAWSGGGWFVCGNMFCKTISLSASLISNRSVVTVCGADGHNTWHRDNIDHLVAVRHIGMDDPADMFGGGTNG